VEMEKQKSCKNNTPKKCLTGISILNELGFDSCFGKKVQPCEKKMEYLHRLLPISG
jgi:hypothetical protein